MWHNVAQLQSLIGWPPLRIYTLNQCWAVMWLLFSVNSVIFKLTLHIIPVTLCYFDILDSWLICCLTSWYHFHLNELSGRSGQGCVSLAQWLQVATLEGREKSHSLLRAGSHGLPDLVLACPCSPDAINHTNVKIGTHFWTYLLKGIYGVTLWCTHKKWSPVSILTLFAHLRSHLAKCCVK